MADEERDESEREHFIHKAKRPDVRLDPETPISELRVRDIQELLRAGSGKSPFFENKTTLKDFFDKDPGEDIFKDPKEDIKEAPKEKNEKPEKDKAEIENKNLIKEKDGEVVKGDTELRAQAAVNNRIVQHLTQLTRRVSDLADQVDQLRARRADERDDSA
jgi:hypothetical protein